MTNEEAVKILDVAKAECEWSAPLDYQEAFGMAIKALKAMDEDLVRRQDTLNCFHCWIDKHGDAHEPDEMAEYRAIENLPSVTVTKND